VTPVKSAGLQAFYRIDHPDGGIVSASIGKNCEVSLFQKVHAWERRKGRI
jgi:hypothetical protein